MEAPDWYRTGRGKGAQKPLPPGLPTAENLLGDRKVAEDLKRAGPAPPSRPPPGPRGGAPSGALPAFPPLPALPSASQTGGALAILPPPSDSMVKASSSDIQQLALKVGDPNALGPTIVKNATLENNDQAFTIPGLQSQKFTEEELLQAWKMMDLEDHGYLANNDLRRVFELVGDPEPSDAELLEMIRIGDRNGGGTIDFEEFCDVFRNPAPLFRNFDLFRRESDVVEPGGASKLDALDSSRTGTSGSTPQPPPLDPREEAVAIITEGTRGLTPKFIKRVYQTFIDIDKEDYGFVTFEAFCLVLRKIESPAMRRAFNIFDCDKMGELDLRQFVVSLSMFTNSSTQEKLRFAFMMYDEDQEGILGKDDVMELIRAMAPHIPERDITKHGNRMYSMHNLHANMAIDLEAFVEYMLEAGEELVPLLSSVGTSTSRTPTRSSDTEQQRRSRSGTPSAPSASSTPLRRSGASSRAPTR